MRRYVIASVRVAIDGTLLVQAAYVLLPCVAIDAGSDVVNIAVASIRHKG